MNDITEEEIQLRLRIALRSEGQSLQTEIPDFPGSETNPSITAAVLIPLLRKEGEWHILYTRRTSTLPEHSGQVSFPGGRSDAEDGSPQHTALREAYEEIGLNSGDVHILGQLNDFLTITNYQITPVVGVIPWPYHFRPATDEVSRIFTIPLSWLRDPQNYQEQKRHLPFRNDSLDVVVFQPYDGEVLWGASARITLSLTSILA